MKNKGIKIIILILCSYTFSFMTMTKSIAFSTEKQVRVGLTSLFSYRDNISIDSKQLIIGYYVNDNFDSELVLSSDKGFMFKPAKEYYYTTKKSYISYSTAKEAVDLLVSKGVNAYAAVTYQRKWKVYVGGSSDKAKVVKQYNEIKGKYGLTYNKIQSDNNRRIKVIGDNDTIIIDTDSNNAYPQFAAKGTNDKNVNLIEIENVLYRGRLEIGRYGEKGSKTLTAVNIVPLEKYLYGVVPCEMSSSWPLEALKAQAICARSYATIQGDNKIESDSKKGYIIKDSVSSQVYKGYKVENNTTNKAVDSTKGKTVKYKGKTITTYYYSTSGGSTEAVEDVWKSALPYLRRTPDLYELEPEKEPWLLRFTNKQFEAKLKAAKKPVGSIKDIVLEVTTLSGRIYSLRFVGNKGSVSFQAEEIRNVLSLYSTKFKIVRYGDKPDEIYAQGKTKKAKKRLKSSYTISAGGKVKKLSKDLEQYIVMSKENMSNFSREAPPAKDMYYLVGMGYGHGVGMSQSGAKGLAKAGYNYEEILKYYFKGTTIK